MLVLYHDIVDKMAPKNKSSEKRVVTYREQRLNVNFMLLLYWAPSYIIDLSSQFPTSNGVHIFTDYWSNWGQTIILIYLIASIFFDLMPEDDRRYYKKMHNSLTQVTVVQAFTVTALYWTVVAEQYDYQSIHEHIMNLVVMIISYSMTDVRFRKRDFFNIWVYGWMYIGNTYLSYLLGRDSVYSVLTWGQRHGSIDVSLSPLQLATYLIFIGFTILHGLFWMVDQLRWKVYEWNNKKNQLQPAGTYNNKSDLYSFSTPEKIASFKCSFIIREQLACRKIGKVLT